MGVERLTRNSSFLAAECGGVYIVRNEILITGSCGIPHFSRDSTFMTKAMIRLIRIPAAVMLLLLAFNGGGADVVQDEAMKEIAKFGGRFDPNYKDELT